MSEFVAFALYELRVFLLFLLNDIGGKGTLS